MVLAGCRLAVNLQRKNNEYLTLIAYKKTENDDIGHQYRDSRKKIRKIRTPLMKSTRKMAATRNDMTMHREGSTSLRQSAQGSIG